MADNALPPNFADKPEQSSFYLGLEYDLAAKAVKQKPINYESKNGNKRVEVPGIMEFEIEPVTNPETGAVIEVTNTIHPMGSNLPIAKSLKGHYSDDDFGLAFDNTGKNGHFREFAWSG